MSMLLMEVLPLVVVVVGTGDTGHKKLLELTPVDPLPTLEFPPGAPGVQNWKHQKFGLPNLVALYSRNGQGSNHE